MPKRDMFLTGVLCLFLVGIAAVLPASEPFPDCAHEWWGKVCKVRR